MARGEGHKQHQQRQDRVPCFNTPAYDRRSAGMCSRARAQADPIAEVWTVVHKRRTNENRRLSLRGDCSGQTLTISSRESSCARENEAFGKGVERSLEVGRMA